MSFLTMATILVQCISSLRVSDKHKHLAVLYIIPHYYNVTGRTHPSSWIQKLFINIVSTMTAKDRTTQGATLSADMIMTETRKVG